MTEIRELHENSMLVLPAGSKIIAWFDEYDEDGNEIGSESWECLTQNDLLIKNKEHAEVALVTKLDETE